MSQATRSRFARCPIAALLGAVIFGARRRPRLCSCPRRRADTRARWQEQILRDFGWVGQDARVYTVPSVLDCRAPRPGGDSWSCHPNFIAWAKRNCEGIELRE